MFLLGMSLQKFIFNNDYHEILRIEVALSNQFASLLRNDNIKVPDFDITDSMGSSKMISQILNNEKFVIYLGNIECTSCIERELLILHDVFTEDEIQQNMLLLGIFKSRKEQKITETIAQIPTYHMDNPLPISTWNKKNGIIYCIVDSSLKVHNLIDVRQNLSHIDITQIYYRAIAERIRNRKTSLQ